MLTYKNDKYPGWVVFETSEDGEEDFPFPNHIDFFWDYTHLCIEGGSACTETDKIFLCQTCRKTVPAGLRIAVHNYLAFRNAAALLQGKED